MPASPPDAVPTAFDALATVVIARDAMQVPFHADHADHAVDLLLDDLIAQPSNAAERTAHRAAVKSRRGGSGRAVLVVEPSAIARKFMGQRLQGLGYTVHAAETVERAMALLEHHSFAIVFTEFGFAAEAGVDANEGLALCVAIKTRTERLRGTGPAVVIVTGRATAADQVRASLAGCDAFLTKPLAEPALIAVLGEVDPLFN